MKSNILRKRAQKTRRQNRVRAKVGGTIDRPRLSVYRSLTNIYAQLIDDASSKTLVAASSLEVKNAQVKGKVELAVEVGKLLAERAVAQKIKKVVFDRGGNKYHGRVSALAKGAREGGLEF